MAFGLRLSHWCVHLYDARPRENMIRMFSFSREAFKATKLVPWCLTMVGYYCWSLCWWLQTLSAKTGFCKSVQAQCQKPSGMLLPCLARLGVDWGGSLLGLPHLKQWWDGGENWSEYNITMVELYGSLAPTVPFTWSKALAGCFVQTFERILPPFGWWKVQVLVDWKVQENFESLKAYVFSDCILMKSSTVHIPHEFLVGLRPAPTTSLGVALVQVRGIWPTHLVGRGLKDFDGGMENQKKQVSKWVVGVDQPVFHGRSLPF